MSRSRRDPYAASRRGARARRHGYGTGGGVTPGVSSGGRPPPGHRRDSAGEQSHALRSMSGVLIKEWSAFVLKEVRARKEVERQMLELRDEMRGMADAFRAEIGETRAGWISDAQFYGAKVREAYESQAAQREKVMTMAARTFFQRWLTKAWRKWVQVTEDQRRRRTAANRALRRMYLRGWPRPSQPGANTPRKSRACDARYSSSTTGAALARPCRPCARGGTGACS